MYVDRRDPEPDPLPPLPPPRRGLAPGLVPDRPQARAVGLAAADRRALRPGGPARPAGRRHPGPRRSSSSEMPFLNVLSFWLFALATSVFSAMNERELRHRRADLQALVDIGARLDDVSDPVRQSQTRHRWAGRALRLRARRRPRRLRRPDGRPGVVRHGRTRRPSPRRPDAIVARAWDRRRILAVRQLEPSARPGPGRRSCPDAPQPPRRADDRRRPGGRRGRRRASARGPSAASTAGSTSVLGQLCSIAALNLRNAVLLRHVQDLAERDALTGAANRRMFQLSLERVLDDRGPAPRVGRDHRRPVHRPRRLQGRQRLHWVTPPGTRCCRP